MGRCPKFLAGNAIVHPDRNDNYTEEACPLKISTSTEGFITSNIRLISRSCSSDLLEAGTIAL